MDTGNTGDRASAEGVSVDTVPGTQPFKVIHDGKSTIAEKRQIMEDVANEAFEAEQVAKRSRRIMVDAQLNADAAFARWMDSYKEWSDADEAENGPLHDQLERHQAAWRERHSSQGPAQQPEWELTEDAGQEPESQIVW
jgi:hypothetical protein